MRVKYGREAIMFMKIYFNKGQIKKRNMRKHFLKLNNKEIGCGLKNRFNLRQTFLRYHKKGQGLIEYLILIALMGVATIGIVRTLNQTVKARFANAIYALQGKNQKAKTHTIRKEEYQRSDLSNFMSSAASTDKKSRQK